MPRTRSAASCRRPGNSRRSNFPGDGVRVDTGVEAGGEVSPFYDPMIAKVIAHAPTREKALDRLADALDRTMVAGPRTNLGIPRRLCRAGISAPAISTPASSTAISMLIGAVPQKPDPRRSRSARRICSARGARVAARRDPELPASPWDAADGFQLAGARDDIDAGRRGRKRRHVRVAYGASGPSVQMDGGAADPLRSRRERGWRLRPAQRPPDRRASGANFRRASMPNMPTATALCARRCTARCWRCWSRRAPASSKGQRVAIIEAMKMEHALVAPRDGIVAEVAVDSGSAGRRRREAA